MKESLPNQSPSYLLSYPHPQNNYINNKKEKLKRKGNKTLNIYYCALVLTSCPLPVFSSSSSECALSSLL